MSESQQLPKEDELKKPLERAEGISATPEERREEGVLLVESDEHAQLYVEGYGLFLGKHSERIQVKKGKEILAEALFFRVQEICVGSRGSFP